MDNEDKLAWCKHGEALESRFISEIAPLAKINAEINPEKIAGDKYAHDLMANGKKADLKCVNTPFFRARDHGFTPDNTVTFNHKDYLRYMYKYPDLWVLFWVKWEDQERYGIKVHARHGLWIASMEMIDNLITHRRTGFHRYMNRTEDNQGNAKSSHIISIGDLRCRWLSPEHRVSSLVYE